MRKVYPEDIALMQELRDGFMTLKEIAEKFDIETATVFEYTRKPKTISVSRLKSSIEGAGDPPTERTPIVYKGRLVGYFDPLMQQTYDKR